MQNYRIDKSGAVFVKRTARDKEILQLKREIKAQAERIKFLEDYLGISTKTSK